jgi:hypothetical protein
MLGSVVLELALPARQRQYTGELQHLNSHFQTDTGAHFFAIEIARSAAMRLSGRVGHRTGGVAAGAAWQDLASTTLGSSRVAASRASRLLLVLTLTLQATVEAG